MCGQSTSTQQTNGNTSRTYSPWVTNAGQSIFNSANGYVGANPYQGYYGPTSSPVTGAQNAATGALQANLGQNNPLTNQAAGTVGSVAGAIDPNASITSLMDPYVQASLAPTIQSIQDAAGQQHQQNAANATMAGAYGGTGQGVTDALTNRYEQQNIGNATGQAESAAYNAATALKQNQLGTLLQAGAGQNTIGQGQATNQTTTAQLLGAMGLGEQQVGQQGINTAIAVNNSNQSGQLGQYATLASLLGAIPQNTYGTSNQTQTTTQPNNAILGLLGAGLGAAAPGGGSIGGNLLSGLFNFGSK